MDTLVDIRPGHIVHSSQTGVTYYVDKVNPKNFVLIALDNATPEKWPSTYNYRRSGVGTLQVEERDLTDVEKQMLKNAYVEVRTRPRTVVREVDPGVRLGAAVTVPNSDKIDPNEVFVVIQDEGAKIKIITLGGNEKNTWWSISRASVKTFSA